jgi:hypothetical protein
MLKPDGSEENSSSSARANNLKKPPPLKKGGVAQDENTEKQVNAELNKKINREKPDLLLSSKLTAAKTSGRFIELDKTKLPAALNSSVINDPEKEEQAPAQEAKVNELENSAPQTFQEKEFYLVEKLQKASEESEIKAIQKALLAMYRNKLETSLKSYTNALNEAIELGDLNDKFARFEKADLLISKAAQIEFKYYIFRSLNLIKVNEIDLNNNLLDQLLVQAPAVSYCITKVKKLIDKHIQSYEKLAITLDDTIDRSDLIARIEKDQIEVEKYQKIASTLKEYKIQTEVTINKYKQSDIIQELLKVLT